MIKSSKKAYEEYLEKARANAKAYYEKKKNDPVFKEKARARWRKWKERQKKKQAVT